MSQLQGRRALVTGGASGIGRATTRRFLDEGARVVIVDRNEDAGKSVAGEIGCDFVRADAGDPVQVAEAFREAQQILGGLDIAYMNAGVTIRAPDARDRDVPFDIAAMTDEEYFRILNINVNGVVWGVREAAKVMASNGGSILATASLAGLIAYQGDPIYALTKHAVVGLVRGLGPALAERGITVNAICPGIVDTPLLGPDAKKFLDEAGFPLIPPSDIAEACVRAITSGESGRCWTCQPGRDPVMYEFRGIPGPRAEGAVGMAPPASLRGGD